MKAGAKIFSIALMLFLIALAGCSITGYSSFEDTLQEINQTDSKYGTSLHDYDNGVAYLRYNPRYPNPLNAEDIDAVVSEFAGLGNGTKEGSPGRLLVEARADLLQSEKSYKLATKTGRGLTAERFSCSDMIFVEAATINFGSSVDYGRSAVYKLSIIAENYSEEAEKIGISKFWVKYLNSTYDILEKDVAINKKRIVQFCAEK